MTIFLIIIGLVAVLVGYLLFLMILKVLPKRLSQANYKNKQEVLKEAERQAEAISLNSRSQSEDQLQLMNDDLEDNMHQKQKELEFLAQEFDTRESQYAEDELRLEKEAQEIERNKQKVERLQQKYDQLLQETKQDQEQVIKKLSATAKTEVSHLKEQIKEDLVTSRQLQAQKIMKQFVEDLDVSSRRHGERVLSRLLSRYQPEFMWPKLVNHVELVDRSMVGFFEQDDSAIFRELKELAGIEIELQNDNERFNPLIKLAGGFGLYREGARLTLEDILRNPNKNQVASLAHIYERHLRNLNHQAIELGQRACFDLQIEPMHLEIQRLIGCLNWRTSYRQNQYWHSLEVAKLAGVLAFELGADSQEAKRCGILHDIGKALDYRIEGSHAVISGDYADRYGENKLICDTVMSHHNDLVLETPLSYILKAADTLSGARPGARVNLEAGYHGRLTGIDEAVNSFPGIIKVSIMNGGREVHVEVNHKRIKEKDLEKMTNEIAAKISAEVAFPGQIKILVSRKFESVAVA
ncbi:MAG: HDIG domain-containing protein [Oligoflexales bacterium]|nr:HDIG domain-containing protein [Oligoflexales bacterium]